MERDGHDSSITEEEESLRIKITEAKAELESAEAAGNNIDLKRHRAKIVQLRDGLNQIMKRKCEAIEKGQMKCAEERFEACVIKAVEKAMNKYIPVIADGVMEHLKIYKAFNNRVSRDTIYKILGLINSAYIRQAYDSSIPCCFMEDELPPLQSCLSEYKWEMGGRLDIQKGFRWVNDNLCLEGTIAIPVHNEGWKNTVMDTFDVDITASGTMFLIVLDVAEVRDLLVNPTQEQLTENLRYLVGVYYAEPQECVTLDGVMSIWPQAVVQALALNQMTDKSRGDYFIPFIAGDFSTHTVLHMSYSSTGKDGGLHAAKGGGLEEGAQELAIRYMKHLLCKTKEVISKALQGKYKRPSTSKTLKMEGSVKRAFEEI